MTALPSFLCFWILPIIPEIIVNNIGISNPEKVSQIAGIFDAAFFIGLIVGSLLWPYSLRYISKRNALLTGMVFQGIFNAITGQMKSTFWLIFFRFLTACCSNVNTIGKDFIFVFAKQNYRQYAYSVKNVFSVAAAFGGPILGYYIYKYSGHDLGKSLILISLFYVIGILIFLVVFYLDFRDGHEIENEPIVISFEDEPINNSDSIESGSDSGFLAEEDKSKWNTPGKKESEEELQSLVEEIPVKSPQEEKEINLKISNEAEGFPRKNKLSLKKKIQTFNDSLIVSRQGSKYKNNKTLWEVFKVCLKEKHMRNLIVVYFLTNGVYKAQVLVSILFLETPWTDMGFGLNSKTVATINLYCYIPVALSILVSPIFVPKKVAYSTYTKVLVLVLSLAIFMVPFSRDLLDKQNSDTHVWVIYGVQAVINCATPKMYSPFLNYIMNKSMHKDYRTSLNSITFILSNLSAACLVLLVVPFYSISVYNPFFTQYAPWNKYFCFVIMDVLLLASVPFIRSMNKEFFTALK